jgi:SAM-dependent methyltransferase
MATIKRDAEREIFCRICQSSNFEYQINLGKRPIVHNLLKDCQAYYESYFFHLSSCKTCGFIQLVDPIPANILYENYFTVSGWKNQPHVPRLLEVIENMSAFHKSSNILDVGCNDGSFLNYLKTKGYSNLTGIEPTKDAYALAISKGFDVENIFLTESLAHSKFRKGSYDLITARQVLEHIIDLDDFVRSLKYLLSEDGTLVIEIPDSTWNLEFLDYALWEEHVNYFTLSTVRQLLEKNGFTIVHYEITLFSGRALTVFCQKNESEFVPLSSFKNNDEVNIIKFFSSFEQFKLNLHEYIHSIRKPIAIYGCGARSSNFVNFTEIGSLLTHFIDDQIEKQNLIVPGCNLKILPFDVSITNDYFFLLGVNTENERKVIENKCLNTNSYASVLPPSIYLPKFWKKMIAITS